MLQRRGAGRGAGERAGEAWRPGVIGRDWAGDTSGRGSCCCPKGMQRRGKGCARDSAACTRCSREGEEQGLTSTATPLGGLGIMCRSRSWYTLVRRPLYPLAGSPRCKAPHGATGAVLVAVCFPAGCCSVPAGLLHPVGCQLYHPGRAAVAPGPGRLGRQGGVGAPRRKVLPPPARLTLTLRRESSC